MDASPADLFFNRMVRSTTPGSGRRNLDLERAQQKWIEEQHTIRKKLGRGRLSLEVFKKGDRVRVQDVRNKTGSIKGTVTSEVFHEGAQTPSSYYILSDAGGQFLRNGKFIRLLEQQSSSQNTNEEGVGLQPESDSGNAGSLGDEESYETRERVHSPDRQRPRRQVQFREVKSS